METVRLISVFALLGMLLGCTEPGKVPFMVDGPGMVYVDKEHRTQYANTLPFDEIDDCSYWAVAYLGEDEDAEKTANEYINNLFAELSEEERSAAGHYDYGSQKRYLVIPRYPDRNTIIKDGDKNNPQFTDDGTPFIINCGANVTISIDIYGGHTIVLDTDEDDKLIHSEDVWDITHYTD